MRESWGRSTNDSYSEDEAKIARKLQNLKTWGSQVPLEISETEAPLKIACEKGEGDGQRNLRKPSLSRKWAKWEGD